MQIHIMPSVPYVPVQHTLKQVKLYLFVIIFTIGNVLLPMAVHTIPAGGIIFQPILFFTLVAAYSEGLLAGMLVAVASPLMNYMITGMPPLAMLPGLLFKSFLIAVLATIVCNHLKKISFLAIAIIIVSMQVLGGFFDYFILGNAERVLNNLLLGIPGLVIITVGGYVLLRFIATMRR